MEKTLEDIRTLIRENILPRITEMECQLADLRRVTWPVCQNIIDEKYGVFSTIPQKRKFMYHLDDSDARKLLERKGKLGNTPVLVTALEYQQIYNRNT
jgi:hypothetical protein